MRTGIFGGSFNPVHNGHLQLARCLLEQAQLDEVWLLVTPQNPWKQNAELLPDDFRLEVLKMALEDEPRLVASDFEFQLPKPSYTWNTLQALSAEYPDRSFMLLVGGDNWARFDHWYHSVDILNHYEIAVYPRVGEDIDIENLPPRVRCLNSPLINISSTEVRHRLRHHLPIDHLVPQQIVRVLEEHYGLLGEND